MEISLIYVDISFKRVTSTWFLELLQCLVFLKNNQPKIILGQKSIFWDANSCLLQYYILTYCSFLCWNPYGLILLDWNFLWQEILASEL